MLATPQDARDDFREFLVKHTGCSVQGGYPCGTCFMDLLNKLGLDEDAEEYKQHNDDYARHNEVWRAVLQIREHDKHYKE